MINILIHSACSLLILALGRRIWKKESAALLASACFAVFPCHGEAVGWIAARDNLLAALFSLAAVHFFLKQAPGSRLWRGRLLSSFFLLLALLCKEHAIVVPGIFLISWTALAVQEQRLPLFSALRRGLSLSLPAWLLTIGFLLWRGYLLGGSTAIYSDIAPPDALSSAYWLSRADMIGILIAPLRADIFPTVLRLFFALTSLLLLLRLFLKTEHRLVGLFFLLWMAGAFVPLHWVTVDPVSFEGSRQLYQIAAPWALLMGAALSLSTVDSPSSKQQGTKQQGERRSRVAQLMVIAYPLLLLAALLPSHFLRHDASRIGRRIYLQLVSLVNSFDGDLCVVSALPYEHRGVHVATNDGQLGPAWQDEEYRGRVTLYTVRNPVNLIHSILHEEEHPELDIQRRIWNQVTEQLDMPKTDDGKYVLRGRIIEENGVHRLACSNLSIEGDENMIEQYKGQLLEMNVRELGEKRLQLMSAKAAKPLLQIPDKLRIGDLMKIRVQTEPKMQVFILQPGTHAFTPVLDFGTVFLEKPRTMAMGFADRNGIFAHEFQIPDDDKLVGIDLRIQVIIGNNKGFAAISACECRKLVSKRD